MPQKNYKHHRNHQKRKHDYQGPLVFPIGKYAGMHLAEVPVEEIWHLIHHTPLKVIAQSRFITNPDGYLKAAWHHLGWRVKASTEDAAKIHWLNIGNLML